MMSRRRVQTLARRVAGQEPSAWINELEALLQHDPSLSMSAAAEWFGVNRDTISCWLRAFVRDDLLILLRHSKRPSDWAELAARAVDADPALSLAGFATRYGVTPATIASALTKAGRPDLLDGLRSGNRYRRSWKWDALAEEALAADPGLNCARFAARQHCRWQSIRKALIRAGRKDLAEEFRRRSFRTSSEWVQLAEQALRDDPTLTMAGFAAQHGRTLQAARQALIRAERRDLVDQFRSRSRFTPKDDQWKQVA